MIYLVFYYLFIYDNQIKFPFKSLFALGNLRIFIC
jgi:hypothetical protein